MATITLFAEPWIHGLVRKSYGAAYITVTAPASADCRVTVRKYMAAVIPGVMDSKPIKAGQSFAFLGLEPDIGYSIQAVSLDGNDDTSLSVVTALSGGASHTIDFSSGSGGSGSGPDGHATIRRPGIV